MEVLAKFLLFAVPMCAMAVALESLAINHTAATAIIILGGWLIVTLNNIGYWVIQILNKD